MTNFRRFLYIQAVFLLFTGSILFAVPAWKFMIVGDSRSSSATVNNGVNVPILSEIADEAVRQDVDFILFPGDLVNGGVSQTVLQSQLATWMSTMRPVYDAGIKVYAVRGNHDVGSPAGTTAWKNVFSGVAALPQNGPAGELSLTYSVAHKNVFVLALDQYVSSMRVNQPWVDAQLAANTLPHVVAFGHVPAFKVDHSDCLDDYATQRNTFWQSLKNAGCKIYACGHDHFYDHSVIDDLDGDPDNNIHQYLVGTAGAPLRSWSPPYNGNNSGMTVEQWHYSEQYGYVLVDVQDDENMRPVWYGRDPVSGDYMPALGSADLDGNHFVDINDLAILSMYWLSDGCRLTNDFCNGADIDQLTTVDIDDFKYFSEKWLENL